MAMTVGDLRAYIADQPENTPVFVIGDDAISRPCLPVKVHDLIAATSGHKVYLVSDEDPA